MFKSLQTFLALFIGIAMSCLSHATFPPRVTDVDLAVMPVVVVGYWPKTKWVDRSNVVRNLCYDVEAQTKLVITKVIHGDLKPGTVDLLVKDYVAWEEDGSMINSATSSEQLGDVKDVSKPNIWFLKWDSSWQKNDQKTYLHIPSFRCVQPTNLKQFYEILRKPTRQSDVSPLFQSRNPLIIQRLLSYVSDEIPPWPEISSFIQNEDGDVLERYGDWDTSKRVHALIPNILALAKSNGPSAITALALFAEMTGEKALPELRTLLTNRDPNVSAVAAAWCVRLGDHESWEQICKALSRCKDSDTVNQAICVIQKSKRVEYVPTLIDFLEFTSKRNAFSEEARTTLTAQKALRALTRFTFPFDSNASSYAWNRVSSEESEARANHLQELLGQWDNPFEATCKVVPDTNNELKKSDPEALVSATAWLVVTIKNKTDHPITIAELPRSIDQNSSRGSTSHGGQASAKRYVSVAAAKTYTFKVPFFDYGKGFYSLSFGFFRNGRETGKKAWIGSIKTSFYY